MKALVIPIKTHIEVDGSFPSGNIYNLNRLQHIGDNNDTVSRLDHPSCFQQGETSTQVLFHVSCETKVKWCNSPVQFQAPPC